MNGVKYEHEPITHPFDDTVGGQLAHIGVTLPHTTIGRFKPTHPVTWALRGAVLTTAMFAWWLTVGGVLLFVGLTLLVAEESWASMQSRRVEDR